MFPVTIMLIVPIRKPMSLLPLLVHCFTDVDVMRGMSLFEFGLLDEERIVLSMFVLL